MPQYPTAADRSWNDGYEKGYRDALAGREPVVPVGAATPEPADQYTHDMLMAAKPEPEDFAYGYKDSDGRRHATPEPADDCATCGGWGIVPHAWSEDGDGDPCPDCTPEPVEPCHDPSPTPPSPRRMRPNTVSMALGNYHRSEHDEKPACSMPKAAYRCVPVSPDPAEPPCRHIYDGIEWAKAVCRYCGRTKEENDAAEPGEHQ